MGQHQLNHLPQKPKNTHRHIAFLPLVMAPAQSQSALFQKPTEESKRNGIKHFGCFMKDELDLDSMDQLRPEHINDNELKIFFLQLSHYFVHNHPQSKTASVSKPYAHSSILQWLSAIKLALEEEKRFEDMWGKRNASNNEPFWYKNFRRAVVNDWHKRWTVDGEENFTADSNETMGNEELGDHLLPLLKYSSIEFLKCSERRFILCLMSIA
jgi:hypothetical protein